MALPRKFKPLLAVFEATQHNRPNDGERSNYWSLFGDLDRFEERDVSLGSEDSFIG